MKRIVLLGSSGQLGWELQRSLAPLADLVALDRRGVSRAAHSVRDAADLPPLCGDLGHPDALARTIRTLGPDVVVNAAAYTAVDRAETEYEAAASINSRGPGVLAGVCAELGAVLVHFSTDYVFDGSGDRPWTEQDRTAPLNVYGRTKLDGEERIRESGCRHLILRTSWLHARHGVNFPTTILGLAVERNEMKVVTDRVGAPTGAELLADVTAHVLRILAKQPEMGGTYHVAAAGETSLFDYARVVIERARERGWPVRVSPASITPVLSSDSSTPATRPKNSRLNCRKLESDFDLRMPPWQDGVERLVVELSGRATRRDEGDHPLARMRDA